MATKTKKKTAVKTDSIDWKIVNDIVSAFALVAISVSALLLTATVFVHTMNTAK